MYVRVSGRAVRKGERLPYKKYKVHMTVLLLSVHLAFTLSFAISYALEEKV